MVMRTGGRYSNLAAALVVLTPPHAQAASMNPLRLPALLIAMVLTCSNPGRRSSYDDWLALPQHEKDDPKGQPAGFKPGHFENSK